MAKKSVIVRNQKRILLVQKYKNQRKILIEAIKTKYTLKEKLLLHTQLQKLPRNSSKTRLRNRCNITGRPRAYYRYFGISRHPIRKLAHKGLLSGVKKSSW